MPSIRQKRIAVDLAARKHKTAKELLISNGYSEITATANAKEVLESKGVQEALEYIGFTEANAKAVVTEILQNKQSADSDRLSAAREVFRVLGSYAPEKKVVLTARIPMKDPRLQKIQEEYEAKVKEQLVVL